MKDTNSNNQTVSQSRSKEISELLHDKSQPLRSHIVDSIARYERRLKNYSDLAVAIEVPIKESLTQAMRTVIDNLETLRYRSMMSVHIFETDLTNEEIVDRKIAALTRAANKEIRQGEKLDCKLMIDYWSMERRLSESKTETEPSTLGDYTEDEPSPEGSDALSDDEIAELKKELRVKIDEAISAYTWNLESYKSSAVANDLPIDETVASEVSHLISRLGIARTKTFLRDYSDASAADFRYHSVKRDAERLISELGEIMMIANVAQYNAIQEINQGAQTLADYVETEEEDSDELSSDSQIDKSVDEALDYLYATSAQRLEMIDDLADERALREEVEGSRQLISELEELLAQREHDLEVLHKELNRLLPRKIESDEKLSQAQATISDLESALRNERNKSEALMNKVDELDERLDGSQKTAQSQRSDVITLQRQLSEAQGTINEFDRQMKKARELVDMKSQANNALQREISDLRLARRDDLKGLADKIDAIVKENDELRTQLDDQLRQNQAVETARQISYERQRDAEAHSDLKSKQLDVALKIIGSLTDRLSDDDVKTIELGLEWPTLSDLISSEELRDLATDLSFDDLERLL